MASLVEIIQTDHKMAEMDSVSSLSQPEIYNIRLRDCGSTYGRMLRDVEGFTLVDDEGKLLNVYTRSMKQMMDTGRIRAIRSIRNGYLYFVTCDFQRRRFQDERQNGSINRNTTYYVYMDKEDLNGSNYLHRQ